MKGLKQKGLALVADDLAEIEDELKKNLTPYLEVVKDAASHILFSGGKRLRPLLMVLSARICGYAGNYDKTFSVVFEYLHAASLLHDDLVDKAALRRGKPVANAVWGNEIAVLVGDFLLARVLSIAAETKKIKIIRAIAEITENMSQGEIHQLINKGRLDLSEEEYLEVIKRKTAVLIQGACATGAMIAGAPEKYENALSDYGFHLGMSFQMVDDLLDYTSDTKRLGKEVGADIKEGKLTLPLIYALKHAGQKDRTWMKKTIKNKKFTVADFNILKRLLKEYGGIDYTEKLAEEHVSSAKNALSVMRDSQPKQLLLMLAEYARNRKN